MTYKKNFVAAIKVGGRVLRESSDRVELPFGSEYSVLLKNLDSVRMQARITIDGKDATGWLIIGPNQSVDVERFVENLDRGNRFKFISVPNVSSSTVEFRPMTVLSAWSSSARRYMKCPRWLSITLTIIIILVVATIGLLRLFTEPLIRVFLEHSRPAGRSRK